MCPLNECNGQPVLPIGLRDTLRYHEAMVYCPRCGLIFHPAQKQLNFRDDNLDGAFFGTTFAHLLLMQVSPLVICSGYPSCCFIYLPLVHPHVMIIVLANSPPCFFISAVPCPKAKEEVENSAICAESFWLQNPC